MATWSGYPSTVFCSAATVSTLLPAGLIVEFITENASSRVRRITTLLQFEASVMDRSVALLPLAIRLSATVPADVGFLVAIVSKIRLTTGAFGVVHLLLFQHALPPGNELFFSASRINFGMRSVL